MRARAAPHAPCDQFRVHARGSRGSNHPDAIVERRAAVRVSVLTHAREHVAAGHDCNSRSGAAASAAAGARPPLAQKHREQPDGSGDANAEEHALLVRGEAAEALLGGRR